MTPQQQHALLPDHQECPPVHEHEEPSASNGAPAEASPSERQASRPLSNTPLQPPPPLSNGQRQPPYLPLAEHLVLALDRWSDSAASSGAEPSEVKKGKKEDSPPQQVAAEDDDCVETNLPSDILSKALRQAPGSLSLSIGQRHKNLLFSLERSSDSAASSEAGPSKEDSPPQQVVAEHKDCEEPSLPSDLVLEVLYRSPARFIHRFTLTSKVWQNLIAEPSVGKKLAQPFAGFFYHSYDFFRDPRIMRCFARICGQPVDPCLDFVPSYCVLELVDTCNGLLLCRTPSVEIRYVVCNPATRRWFEIPPSPSTGRMVWTARLGFDPLGGCDFRVFEFLDVAELQSITAANIFFSETKSWSHHSSGWGPNICLKIDARSVFINQRIHMITSLSQLAVLDAKGEVWNVFSNCDFELVGVSQGRLHCVTFSDSNIFVWCLENYDSRLWKCKFDANKEDLCQNNGKAWKVIGIHPDYDSLFLATMNDTKIASYHMKLRKFEYILDLEEGCQGQYLPYVPIFQDQLQDVQCTE